MNLLVLADRFSLDGKDTWLVEDLVMALLRQGASVDVVVKDMSTPRALGEQPPREKGLRVFSVGVATAPTRAIQRRSRLPRAMLRLRTNVRAWLSQDSYDAVIYTGIAWSKAGLPQRLVRAGSARCSVLIYWDFFPIHQQEIGHLPTVVTFAGPLLRAIERSAVKSATVVAVMSPENERFFTSYFGSEPELFLRLPPWGKDTELSASTSLNPRPVAVFGGQLAKGRGFEDLLTAAEILKVRNAAVSIDIYGQGPIAGWLTDQILTRKLTNVNMRGRVPRDVYQREIRTAMCGLAATVNGVSVPTFPSKIIDYAALGLPIIASTEATGDVGRILEDRGAGIAVRAGRPSELAEALETMARSVEAGTWSKYAQASRAWFEDDLSAETAAKRILGAIQTVIA